MSLSGTPSANDNGINSTTATTTEIDSNGLAALARLPSGNSAMQRLKSLFAREHVLWAGPINPIDQGLLGVVAHNIDLYFASEDYVRDFGFGHHLLVIGDIMMQTGARAKKAQADWAVRRNAIAFDEAAWVKRNAALALQHAAVEKEKRAVGEKKRFAEERRRWEALDEASRVAADERAADKVAARGETSLRQANHVETMLDEIEMEEEVDMAEFEAQFEEGVGLEEDFAEMDLGE
jgi:hypothetical protein